MGILLLEIPSILGNVRPRQTLDNLRPYSSDAPHPFSQDKSAGKSRAEGWRYIGPLESPYKRTVELDLDAKGMDDRASDFRFS